MPPEVLGGELFGADLQRGAQVGEHGPLAVRKDQRNTLSGRGPVGDSQQRPDPFPLLTRSERPAGLVLSHVAHIRGRGSQSRHAAHHIRGRPSGSHAPRKVADPAHHPVVLFAVDEVHPAALNAQLFQNTLVGQTDQNVGQCVAQCYNRHLSFSITQQRYY